MATDWTRRIRGAVGMGLTWAVGWAIAGIGVGVTSVLLPFLPWDALTVIFDAPLPALAVPGFVGGGIFSIVLGVAARNRRFDQLSLLAFTALGALGGVLLSLVPSALVIAGLASLGRPDLSLLRITLSAMGPLALLSAGSAATTLLLARRAEDPLLPRTHDPKRRS